MLPPNKPIGRAAILIPLACMVLFIGMTMRSTIPAIPARPVVATAGPDTVVDTMYISSDGDSEITIKDIEPEAAETPAPVRTSLPTRTPDGDVAHATAQATKAGFSRPVKLTVPPKSSKELVILPAATEPPPTKRPLPSPAPGPTPHYAYSTEDMRIEVRQHNLDDTVYFTAEIWLTDVSQLRSAFSSDRFDGATEPVKDIAERNNAVLAINGDFATFNNGGIILRNGELYRANRSTRQLLVIDQNGDFIPYVDPPEKAEEAAAEFLSQGVWQTLVFGPLLVENGEAVPLPGKFFVSTGATVEPRTAIGQIGPLHYLWIVVDGRQDNYSEGVSLTRLQDLFLRHGVTTAFNLDGGGSTTLYFQGSIINRPANGSQRHVPDILYIAE